jgi:hydroxyacylglutathione hydrolase
MLLRRLYHDRLAQAAYLVACQETREAIVVDPLRDPAPYLEAARQDGVTITMVTETHIHADFLSGAAALADAAGATLLLSGEGAGPAGYQRAAFPRARWLRDGDCLHLGKVRLEVTHVPGHTPEHVAFLVTDTAVDDAPMGLLSGDFLFVGDVGRPDLLERAAGMQGTMAQSARDLHASLRRLAPLPDYLQVWPGHGAGSACGKALGAVPQTTLGYERRTNWALRAASEDEFVERVLAGQPEPPAYFATMKRQNAAGAPPIPFTSAPTSSEALHAAVADGALVVDVRPAAEFAARHYPASLNVPLGGSFLGWAGSVIPSDRDVVLVTSDAQRGAAKDAVRELHLIGIDRVRGVLPFDQLVPIGAVAATIPSIPATELTRLSRNGTTVLDVRNRSEWDEGHVPGARLVPLPELAARIGELRGAGPIAVHCQGGSRSSVAASMLRASGIVDVTNVDGGYAAWVQGGNAPAIDR